ncbi:MAG: aldo/keto reductase [Segetibacter sp.]|nr:aldo/keto reductase [Segetibacter sp.]
MDNKLTRRDILKLITCAGTAAIANPLLSFSMQDNMMLQRIIPASGERLPVVGLGSWLQFDVGTASAEREPLKEVLRKMNEHGGRLIDSSPMYGKAEQVIGDLATETGLANKFFYATKVWTTGKQSGISQMESSLNKMKRTSIDLIQVHNLTDWQTHLNTLKDWKQQGKVRYTGITHYTVSAHQQLQQIVQSKAVDFVQFNYSIRVRNAEKSLLPAAKDNGVAVIINEPFESGSLFNAVKGKALPTWAAEDGINSWAQFFLKYILSHPAVNCVIPGTSNPVHVVDNMQAGYGRLPGEKTRKKMVEYIESL